MALLYLEDYLDTIEALPVELGRNFTLMRELDSRAQDSVARISQNTSDFLSDLHSMSPEDRVKMLQDISASLKETLRHGEEKVALAVQTYDMVDRHVRRLDDDLHKFEEEQMTGPKLFGSVGPYEAGTNKVRNDKTTFAGRAEKRSAPSAADTPSKKHKKTAGKLDDKLILKDSETPKRPANAITSLNKLHTTLNSKKPVTANAKRDKKGVIAVIEKRLASKDKAGVLDLPIDPNEPTYCMCNQVSFGDMIACDNDDCPIEWFHYACVGLSAPPKGKWYCPTCTREQAK
ncbi:inhibitor of growth proteins N-terminal histone-binding-domain-containing protein [Powellomyces hirtus]|nr:inhibitor of growth proteins N-terminal histone-binding-domain-containing protein [Powellomyces hirtus]